MEPKQQGREEGPDDGASPPGGWRRICTWLAVGPVLLVCMSSSFNGPTRETGFHWKMAPDGEDRMGGARGVGSEGRSQMGRGKRDGVRGAGLE